MLFEPQTDLRVRPRRARARMLAMQATPSTDTLTSSVATEQLRRRVVYITALTLLLVLLVWLAILPTVRDAHEIAVKDSEREGQILTAVIAEQVSRAISAIDYTVSFVAQDFSERREPDRLKRLVESGGVRMDNLVLLSVVDDKGLLIQTNRGPTIPPVDLSDREHIRVHLDGRAKGMFVGKPVRGRASGQWSIQLTRAVLDTAGRPMGVIVGSLDPHYFETFWRSASIPEGMRIEIIGADGALRAINRDVTETLEKAPLRPAIPAILSRLSNGSGQLPEIERSNGAVIYYKQIGTMPLLLRAEIDFRSSAGTVKELRALHAYYFMFGCLASFAILLLGWSLRRSTHQLILKCEEADTARRSLHDAIEAVPEGFVLYGADDRLAIMNQAYRRIYASSSNMLQIGAKFEDIIREGARRGQYAGVGPDDVEAFVRRRMELHRNPGGPFEQQIDDGRWIRIEEKRTVDGGVVGFRSDITQLKQRELALARQTALLSTTLEHMGEGLSVVDHEGRVVAYNSRFSALLNLPDGADIEEALITDLLAIFAQNEHVLPIALNGDAGKAFEDSIATPGKAVEWITGDGRIIELRSSVLPDGGTVTLYNDVTDDRDAAMRIKSSEALKSAMIATSLDGIIIADEWGKILEFNAAAERIFGWQAEEVVGRSIADVIIPHHLRQQHMAGLERFRLERESRILGQRLELPAVHRNGRQFPTEITIAAIDAGGRTRFTAFVRDISERKRVEHEAVAAREAAEAASKAKTEFLAMVSHEFRTPMNGIVGLAELLRTTRLDGRQSSYLEGIEESARRLMVLTTDILDFSRIEAGRLRIVPTTFDLPALVERAVETTRALLAGKTVAVRSSIDEAVPRFVVGDPNRLAQVLGNLLSNSAKFTDRGEITIRVYVDASAETGEGCQRIRLEVTDSGSGIPVEMRDRLFQPFEQGKPDVEIEHGGSGLGLAICRRLMELMGGRIGCVSQQSAGATFWFELELPHGQPMDVLPSRAEQRLPSMGPSLKILVAEDTPTSQLVARSMLERLGHRVAVACNGAEAVELAARQPFDIVLMDIQMPVLDGIEATRQIRGLPGESGRVPIIAVSAQVLPDMLQRATAAGMAGHISKPITIESLAKALAGVAGRCGTEETGLHEPAGEPAATDHAGLREALGSLRTAVDDRVFGELVQGFLAECSEILAGVARGVEEGDHQLLRRLAHKLNGLFGQFGCTRAAEVATRIETATIDADVMAMSIELASLGLPLLEKVANLALDGSPTVRRSA